MMTNLRARCNIRRRETLSVVDGLPTSGYTTAFADVPCTFTVLSAKSYADSTGSDMDFTSTHATLRLPATWPVIPEPGHSLNDYTITMLSPAVGFVRPDAGTWRIESHRYDGPTTEYVLVR